MTNKYYTPTIDEFYIGFECEYQCLLIDTPWHKEVCDQDLISIAFSSYEHEDDEEPFNEQFRVKYLDKEDIESFGFVHLPKKSLKNLTERFEMEHVGRIHPDQGYYYNKLFICYHPDLNQVKLTAGTDGTIKENGDDNEKFFEGIIKNKSELSKLLKQLNINKE